MICCFFFNDTATTEIYTLSYTTLFRSMLDAAMNFAVNAGLTGKDRPRATLELKTELMLPASSGSTRSEEHTSELQSQSNLVCRLLLEKKKTNNNIVIRPPNDPLGNVT